MKKKFLFAAAAWTVVALGSGCATRTTASGGRETTVLGGAVTVSTSSFQPPTPATLDVDTSKVISKGNPSGNKTTIL